MTNSTVARRVARACAGLGALVVVVLVTTAAGMRGNTPAGNDVVHGSSSHAWPWIVLSACVAVGAIAIVLVRRRRRERVS